MIDEKSVTAQTMIAGMPYPQRARASGIYRRGKAEAAAEVEDLLLAGYLEDPETLIRRIGEWVNETKELIK